MDRFCYTAYCMYKKRVLLFKTKAEGTIYALNDAEKHSIDKKSQEKSFNYFDITISNSLTCVLKCLGIVLIPLFLCKIDGRMLIALGGLAQPEYTFRLPAGAPFLRPGLSKRVMLFEYFR